MRKSFIFIFIIATVLLVGCGNTGETKNTSNTVTEVNEENNEGVNENDNDKKSSGAHASAERDLDETLAQFPKEKVDKVITTSVPIAEILHTLSITPVGVPTSTNPLPESFANIDEIGSPMAPDLEKMTDLEADLILSSNALEDSLEESLEGMDLERAYLPTDSYEDLKLSLEALGIYFEKEDEANTLLQEIEENEASLKEELAGKDLPSILLIIGTADSFMVMSEESYLGSLINTFGAENIATTELKVEDRYSPINMESIIAADPDIVFVLSSLDHGASEDMYEKEIESSEAWKNLSAYKNDQIHTVDYSTYGVTSILNVNKALSEIAQYFNVE